MTLEGLRAYRRRERCLASLKVLADEPDKEVAHDRADHVLLDYIGDADIRAHYMILTRWYS